MDTVVQACFQNLQSLNKNIRYQAFNQIFDLTEEKVDWAYEVWDILKKDLTHPDNHRRAMAAQLLANLAISDPENRMLDDFDELLEVTRDKRFVTARHGLQSIWKVGLAGELQRKAVLEGLIQRFKECIDEKNYTLIRYDIIQGMKHLYDRVEDESIKERALELIQIEEDPKYQKKYNKVWR